MKNKNPLLKMHHLSVHDSTAQESDTEEGWAGVLKHLDPSVVVH